MSIKIENVEVVGWEHAIRGMRNPKNSWGRSDSKQCIDSCDDCDNFSVCNPNDESYFRRFWEGGPVDCDYAIGPNDHKLMMGLSKGGPVHAKYRRMIVVYVDITAPLYWWKEFDTYKVGTVANSCSTMHKIHDKEFELEDFSTDHLEDFSWNRLDDLVGHLNICRNHFLETKDKKYWWQMIQLLPSSYNQKRTVMLNYEVLNNIYISRKDHKLDEWHVFCNWIKSLPYSEIITQPVAETVKEVNINLPAKEIVQKAADILEAQGLITHNQAREMVGLEPVEMSEFLKKNFNVLKYDICPACGGAGVVQVAPNARGIKICDICHGEKVIRVTPKAKE